MSIDIVTTCSTALNNDETSVLAITLASLFALYVAIDSALAMSAIVRKSADAERLSARSG